MAKHGKQTYGPLRFFRPMAYDRYEPVKFRCEFFGWCPAGVRPGPVMSRDNLAFIMTSYALWEVQSREWEEYARYLPKMLLAVSAELPDVAVGLILGWPTSTGAGQWRALARLRRLGAVAYAVSRHAKGCDDAVPIIGADEADLAELRRRRPTVAVVDTFSFALGIIHTARDGRHVGVLLAEQLAVAYHEEAAPERRGHDSCATSRVLWAEREFEAATRCMAASWRNETGSASCAGATLDEPIRLCSPLDGVYTGGSYRRDIPTCVPRDHVHREEIQEIHDHLRAMPDSVPQT